MNTRVVLGDKNTLLPFKIGFAFACFSPSDHTHFLKYYIDINALMATINGRAYILLFL
jgi:hypothetical protein